MPVATGTIEKISHISAVLAYALLAYMLWRSKPRDGMRLAVCAASLITAIWALSGLRLAQNQYLPVTSPTTMGTLRAAAWVAVLLLLQRRSLGLTSSTHQSFAVALGLGFIVALQLALDAFSSFGTLYALPSTQEAGVLLFVALRLVMAISGLVLLHNLYVNSGNDGGIRFRLFAVGLGLICAYDLNFYTLYFLLGTPNPTLLALQGAVNSLAAPLFYLAFREEENSQFHLSRQAAFHTVSFSMIGLYLIAMSLLAYGLKVTGGDWGQLLQIIFLVITLVAGALVVLSPRFRAELKVRISRNFYRYRYDYRVEWLRFIDKIDASSDSHHQSPFRERLIEAFATILDCPRGALMEPTDSGYYQVSAHWRWPQISHLKFPLTDPTIPYVTQSNRIILFDQLREEGDPRLAHSQNLGSHGTLSLPDWAADQGNLWLAVPLIHREKLSGILLLAHSIVPRDLNWEDFDLLRTLGLQGASYLAETDTQNQLDEAKSFDEFNRRFAFVMHDVKNVISQLGLMARNAERHITNPEFQADMIATLHSSVGKMNDLLQLMGREANGRQSAPTSETQHQPVDLAQLVSMVGITLRRQHTPLTIEGTDAPAFVMGQETQLDAMITHLLQNAIDASSPDAPISITLSDHDSHYVLSLIDHGSGMSPAFIRDDLFKPFRSTKDGGFGIGAYEAREIVRAHGGQLTVDSSLGQGTCFTVRLPKAAPQNISHKGHKS